MAASLPLRPHLSPNVETMSAPDDTNSPETGITVVTATSAQYPAVIELLVEAFSTDPGFLRVIPQPDSGNHLLRSLFELQIEAQYAKDGHIDVATNEEGVMVGVALWDAPDAGHGALDQAKLLPRLIKIFGPNTAKLVLREFTSARMHPRFPHWYLYTIATTPESRGTGVGSALLAHGLQRAGEEAIYLEATSTRSAQLYHRLGFVPLGYVPDNDDLTSEFAMWKPPAMPIS